MTVVSNAVEREVKLALDLGAPLPDLREVVTASVRQPEQHLCAAYFDTPDLRLWNRGITLRHRTGEGLPRWTLKLPEEPSGEALVRTESEWAGDVEYVPEEAREVLSGIVRRMSLQKVAELGTERIRFELEDDGVFWAELASDVVTVAGGRMDGYRFRQLELEITGGGSERDARARAVIKALRRAGARPDPQPKLGKLLGAPGETERLGRKSSAEDVVRHAISAGLNRLLDHDCRIRVAGAEVNPEDVHQARVATRRLRSDLGTLKALLDPVWVNHVREDLRWAGAALGAVRDTDVLTQNLNAAGVGAPLIQALEDERSSAVVSLQAVMNDSRYLDLLDRLHAASLRPPVTDRRAAARKARRDLPGLVNRRWKKLRSDARAGGRHPDDGQLHQVRKRSKQLRYASELAAPVMGKKAEQTAKAAEALQTLLGEHHDAVVATEWLTRAANVQSVAPLDVVPLLERETRQRNRLARKWRSDYEKLGKRRAWLKGSK